MSGHLLEEQHLPLGHSPKADGRGVANRIAAFDRIARIGGRRLLDAGCGSGPYSCGLAQRFDLIDSADIEPARLAEFRRAVEGTSLGEKITIHEMSITELDFEDCTFDAVTTIETLEHVDRLHDALVELRRVTKPTGRLYITSPNRWFPLETHGAMVRGREIHWAKTPLLPYVKPIHDRIAQARTFTMTSLTAWLARAGWQVRGYTYIMPPFDNWQRGRRLVAPVTERLERSPLAVFGVSVVIMAEPGTGLMTGATSDNATSENGLQAVHDVDASTWWEARRVVRTLRRR